jgi:hypothetical protein
VVTLCAVTVDAAKWAAVVTVGVVSDDDVIDSLSAGDDRERLTVTTALAGETVLTSRGCTPADSLPEVNTRSDVTLLLPLLTEAAIVITVA